MTDQDIARDAIARGESVFVTGKAGTGKSTLLREIRKEYRNSVVCAPTGMAAVNVGGQTIHSLFKIDPKCVDPEDLDSLFGWRADLLKIVDKVIIDEISMVRADLLSLVDARLRAATGKDVPFGGKQMIFFGDMFQLPPVARDSELVEFLDSTYGGVYFFLNPVVQEAGIRLVELTKVYRQTDQDFIDVLNSIRTGTDLDNTLGILNENFGADIPDGSVVLTATNYGADKINEAKLIELPGEFESRKARITGTFPNSMYPTEEFLILKEGARVMLLKNDSEGQYYNGSLGTVREVRSGSVVVQIEDSGKDVEVFPARWENVRYTVQRGKKMKLGLDVVGEFTQLPLRLAWAMTIHKSQGQTFDKVHVDLGNGAFAHGQTYVALSRCRTLEGVSLGRPVLDSDVLVDPLILAYKDRFSGD